MNREQVREAVELAIAETAYRDPKLNVKVLIDDTTDSIMALDKTPTVLRDQLWWTVGQLFAVVSSSFTPLQRTNGINILNKWLSDWGVEVTDEP